MVKLDEFSTLSAKNNKKNNNNNNNEVSLRTAITYVTRGQKLIILIFSSAYFKFISVYEAAPVVSTSFIAFT